MLYFQYVEVRSFPVVELDRLDLFRIAPDPSEGVRVLVALLHIGSPAWIRFFNTRHDLKC